MHPAYSVIVFTTASGAGYGLLFWLGLGAAAGLLPEGRWMALAALVLALGLISAGLIASTLHLGHPERAVRAFSQWRSSWLSREGVAAVATYLPAGVLGLIWLFGLQGALTPLAGVLAALGAAGTVYCTGMIYASLRTIRQWHLPIVPLIYLVLAAGSGALLLDLVVTVAGLDTAMARLAAVAFLLLGAGLKLSYWRQIDADPGQYTAEMALGLPGPVRQLDPPHTRPNFVMREMGYAVGRKHAHRLRRVTVLSLFALPVGLLALAGSGIWPAACALLATLSATLGLVTERWLFFAEAEHVSMLYYGRDRA